MESHHCRDILFFSSAISKSNASIGLSRHFEVVIFQFLHTKTVKQFFPCFYDIHSFWHLAVTMLLTNTVITLLDHFINLVHGTVHLLYLAWSALNVLHWAFVHTSSVWLVKPNCRALASRPHTVNFWPHRTIMYRKLVLFKQVRTDRLL